MSTAECWTRRVVENCRIASAPAPCLPGRAEAGKVLASMVRGSRQRRSGGHQETFGEGNRRIGLELVGFDETHDRVMPPRRLQILANREEIDIGAAQIIHELQHFVALLAEAYHDSRLREHQRVELLDALQESHRVE